VLAWPAFRLLLNHKWEPAASLFAIISLANLGCFLNVVTFQAIWAKGLYRPFLYYSLIFTPVMILAFVIGALLNGATGCAWGLVIMQVSDFVLFTLLTFPLLKIPIRPAVAPLWCPLFAALPSAALALALHRLLPASRMNDILQIGIVGTVGSAA